MSQFDDFSKFIVQNAESLAGEIVNSVIQKTKMNISNTEKEQAFSMYISLLGFLGESLSRKESEAIPETLVAWSKKNAEMQVASGGRISEIIVRYGPTREVFNDLFTRFGIKFGLSAEEHALAHKLIHAMLDVSINETVFAFERLSDQFKEETQKELVALSAPIVPVKEDVVVLPLIGYIDEQRANHITNQVIPQIADMGARYVIADFSGVLTLDIHIAEYFHRIGGTLRLMGITVLATGLRPELARIAVESDIDMSALRSFSTVKQALENIQ